MAGRHPVAARKYKTTVIQPPIVGSPSRVSNQNDAHARPRDASSKTGGPNSGKRPAMVEPFEMPRLALLAASSADSGRSPARPGCRFSWLAIAAVAVRCPVSFGPFLQFYRTSPHIHPADVANYSPKSVAEVYLVNNFVCAARIFPSNSPSFGASSRALLSCSDAFSSCATAI